jgi:hypothetical protein
MVGGVMGAQASMEDQTDNEPIAIDFDLVIPVPEDWRQPIQAAVLESQVLLPSDRHYAVSAINETPEWLRVVLVPAYIVESGWQADLAPTQIVELLGWRQPGTTPEFHMYGSRAFKELSARVPKGFADFSSPSAQSTGSAPATVDYLFPWTSGQRWARGYYSWHDTNALDFIPQQRNTPATDFAILAAATGRLTDVCNDGTQRILRVVHSEGETRYIHMDANAVRTDLLNQDVSRGRFMGLLYNGTAWDSGYSQCNSLSRSSWQWCTRCGWGSTVHIHFEVRPSRDVTVDGHSMNAIAAGSAGALYTSSNTRNDGSGSTPNCADGEGVVLYEHSNYQGRCTRLTGDDPDLSNNTIGNDAASSIKVIGNFQATVYEHTAYTGVSSQFTGDDPDFGNDTIRHDRATSIRVSRRDAGGGTNCDGGQGAYLYEHGNYQGRCTKFTGDSASPGGWYLGNDAASSIRFVGNYEATVYQHSDYQGTSTTFTSDDADFGNNPIGHDQVSSIRVRTRSTGGGTNCDGGQGAYLYEHGNYQGRCTKFTGDSASPGGWYLGNDAASSIRFIGNYEATVYQHDNYQGTSTAFTGDDPDFGNNPIGHDQVSSIRVRTRSSGPTSCADGQFLAEYFNNRNLSGSPTLRRCEASINADWGTGGPGNGVGNDNFSVRWAGNFWFDQGLYRFATRTDDGVRLWVDSQALVNEWRDMGATVFTRDRTMTAGMHAVRMEYYENGGGAVARLTWQRQQQAAQDPDDGRTIGYNQGIDGTINPARDRDDYYFEGSAGQAITIRLDKRDSSIDPYVELYNPDGTLLGQDDDNGGNANSRLAISLRQNGRHKIIAREYGSGTGGYRLSLSQESVADPDDNRWITLGGSLQGTISPNNDRDWYFFSGVAGRSISIRMNKIDSGLDSYLELYNEGGAKVIENDDGGGDRNSWIVYTLPAGGTYRILARSYGLASSGRYNVSVSSVSTNNLARGRSATATSTEFSGVEPYKAFDGNMGTRWSSQFRDPQLIYVNLGSAKTFNQVVLRWEAAFARRYGIFYWTGTEWRQLFWTDSGDGGVDTINFAPTRAQYVGMYGIQRGTQYGYSLWEFEVYDNTALVLPTVPPDPEDKPSETGVDPVTPLAPNDPGKETLLIGEGEEGQENTPLEGIAPEAPTGGTQTGLPSAFILYPQVDPEAGEISDPILFQGLASDNDEDGESIVEYRWTSNLDGPIGSEATFTRPRSSLQPGQHVITFQVRDNEGDWSEPVTTTLTLGNGSRIFLPVIVR